MDVMAIIVYLAVGVVTGVLSGMFGIGGGIVVLPSWAFLFGVEHFNSLFIMHLSVGTSLAVMVGTTFIGVRAHSKKNKNYFPMYRQLAYGLVPGIFFGAMLGHYLHGHVLKVIFGVLVLLVGLTMLLPQPKNRRMTVTLPKPFWMTLMGFFVGMVSALLGVSGSFITVPFLVRCGVKLRLAIMVSAMIGFTVGWGFVGLPHWSTGYVYWPACIAIMLGTIVTVPMGVAWAYRISSDRLHTLFAILLLCFGVHMMF